MPGRMGRRKRGVFMICQYCKTTFEHDHRVISVEGKLFHEVECFTDYMIEHYADETELTYLEYLEKMIKEEY
jgi:hypothetical protein